MLETDCVVDKIEMLVTDFKCSRLSSAVANNISIHTYWFILALRFIFSGARGFILEEFSS